MLRITTQPAYNAVRVIWALVTRINRWSQELSLLQVPIASYQSHPVSADAQAPQLCQQLMPARLPQEIVCSILGQRPVTSRLRRGAYTLGRSIGCGGFGTVYLATLNSSGQTFACKRIDKRNLTSVWEVEAIQMVSAPQLQLPQTVFAV